MERVRVDVEGEEREGEKMKTGRRGGVGERDGTQERGVII